MPSCPERSQLVPSTPRRTSSSLRGTPSLSSGVKTCNTRTVHTHCTHSTVCKQRTRGVQWGVRGLCARGVQWRVRGLCEPWVVTVAVRAAHCSPEGVARHAARYSPAVHTVPRPQWALGTECSATPSVGAGHWPWSCVGVRAVCEPWPWGSGRSVRAVAMGIRAECESRGHGGQGGACEPWPWGSGRSV
jgi:hypothetical protein